MRCGGARDVETPCPAAAHDAQQPSRAGAGAAVVPAYCLLGRIKSTWEVGVHRTPLCVALPARLLPKSGRAKLNAMSAKLGSQLALHIRVV